MARREAAENLCLMRDNISGSKIGVYYRPPTTKERQAYLNQRSKRVGNKFVDDSINCRLKNGKKIMTGLRDGDFERLDGSDYRPISTAKSAENYYPEWRQWMEDNCADIVCALAIRVFEAPVIAGVEEDDETEEDADQD